MKPVKEIDLDDTVLRLLKHGAIVFVITPSDGKFLIEQNWAIDRPVTFELVEWTRVEKVIGAAAALVAPGELALLVSPDFPPRTVGWLLSLPLLKTPAESTVH